MKRAQWVVYEIFDTEVSADVIKALEADTKYVFRLHWDDLLFYRGEDGWCLSDATLDVVEEWLEEIQKGFRDGPRAPLYVRIQRS